MALYHFECKVKSRSNGCNVVATAAYNSGEKLIDEKTGETKYYRNKKDTVIYDKVFLPANAPIEYKDKQNLWNSVERESKRRDAQLCRSYIIAGQREFTLAENIELFNRFGNDLCKDGKCVELDVHYPGFKKKLTAEILNMLSNGNVHAHCMTTMTSINEKGEWNARRIERYVYVKDSNGNMVMEPVLDKNGNPKLDKNGEPVLQGKRVPVIDKKTGKQKLYKGRKVWKKETVETDATRWNSDEYFEKERLLWENLVNEKFREKYQQLTAAFEKTHSESDRLALLRITNPETGGPIQVSRESYEKQGIDKIPSIHLGYKAAAMEARGIKTDRGDINREIKEANDRLVNLSEKHLQLKVDIEATEKDINVIRRSIVTEESYVDKLQKENNHINKVIGALKRDAETFLGTRLSKLEIDELQPLWDKYASSGDKKDYQQITKCVKSIKVERNAVWLVNQVSKHFTGNLDSKDWNRLFNEAKTAYEAKKFAGVCVAATEILAQSLKNGNAPKSVFDSMDLVKKTVGRELSNAEFYKAAKYQFWATFASKNSSTWAERLKQFSLYKQGETNIAKVMDAPLPETEEDLVKFQNRLEENRPFISICNDRCKKIDEPYIDSKKYDAKVRIISQALASIVDDKGKVEDYKNRVHRFHVKMNNILSKKEIDDRGSELESLKKEHEGMKNRMQRLKTTSPGFWLSHKKSFEEISVELEKEKAALKAAEERLEEQRLKAEREKAEYEAKQLEQRLEEARRDQERREYDEYNKPKQGNKDVIPKESSVEKKQEHAEQKQLSEKRKIVRITWGINRKNKPSILFVTWENNTQPSPYHYDRFERLLKEHHEDIAKYYKDKGDEKGITSLLDKMQLQIDIAARKAELSKETGRGPKR